jgi:hypothetical protein
MEAGVNATGSLEEDTTLMGQMFGKNKYHCVWLVDE